MRNICVKLFKFGQVAQEEMSYKDKDIFLVLALDL